MTDHSIRSRALGAYLGLACGDALGATVEFLTKGEIAHQYGVHKHIKGGGWLKLPAGQVTDDTEMSIHLGRAILAAPEWDARRAAEEFAVWLKGVPVDVGDTTRRGIRRFIMHGTLSEPESEYHAGNGAAMRNLPVALATLGDDDAFERWTVEQAHITHCNAMSDAATLTLGHMVRRLVLGGSVRDVRDESNKLIAKHRQFKFQPYRGLATAYIVDTMQTVMHYYFQTDSVESCVVETVNQGGDADTTGAIAGMLAGATYGVETIPPRWLRKLDRDVYNEICAQVDGLLARSPALKQG
ncbi:ADP-ribosyl-(dinitrogen reductase) hydrolase [Azospirillum argentinense]|uniref:ADP-ribosyl-(Dinitrogen reductase) hydrolase n=1 Tax=Azospirillum argentinense TaxID=2970906 RepID=A0A060DHS0_9PROT|nr:MULTISPECIES: ADP-ribosyl-[dinitrogen reductase] hydrolase [Azospirillum]AIB12320.1 ADP-ribosyl-(dinitrogen reductase) hydrolase [Azospirillum argentinense]EZQ09151.1 ADP-ribosyl-(dinitrogen reductase) hydrolase [Azospirillum argentinense]NUB04828.1 ADP-ribosyl-[dinitrogen reductase] hydrolase [Azospirillum baldaniorum]